MGSWVGSGRFGKVVFAHLGELNSEKNQLSRFVFLSFFCDFQNDTSNDQNAISAYFASRFH